MYVQVGVMPPLCFAPMYVLVGVVPLPSVVRYVCAGWCGATSLCCPLCMFWWEWFHPLVLAAIYELVCMVPPLVLPLCM